MLRVQASENSAFILYSAIDTPKSLISKTVIPQNCMKIVLLSMKLGFFLRFHIFKYFFQQSAQNQSRDTCYGYFPINVK